MATLLYCSFLLLSLNAVMTQSGTASGEIRGMVMDDSGTGLSNPSILITSRNTGLSKSVTGSPTGNYSVRLLDPDLYDVQALVAGHAELIKMSVQVMVGQVSVVDFRLPRFAAEPTVLEVTADMPLIETARSQQSSFVDEQRIRQLPIDRRDYLAYSLLAPGVADSEAMADANDFRVVQAAHSGISFYGNNGRGNAVTVDGGEANDSGGGIRPTLSQEAVREFQINRANYSAELGGASGGIINIVSKAGSSAYHGSGYGFFRDARLDAADPFARKLAGDSVHVNKPPSSRQQFGATLGGPLLHRRDTFFFGAFEVHRRNESNPVTILTDRSIFEPTAQQKSVLAALDPETNAAMSTLLSSTDTTKKIFETNSGLFPFIANSHHISLRLDHQWNGWNQLLFRYNTATVRESSPNTKALLGASRAIETGRLDHTALVSWTRTISPAAIHQLQLQFNYGDFLVNTKERFGPELNVSGFGFFNRDAFLPSNSIWRRYELSDGLSIHHGSHQVKVGGQLLVRGVHLESQSFFAGRFNFGTLPGSILNPALRSTTITALQAFNLGIPQSYQQGFGNALVASTEPFAGLFAQDRWQVGRGLSLDFGIRYELDDLRDPVRTDRNNVAPRMAFAWNPSDDGRMTLRGGYGIFFATTSYAIIGATVGLGEANGRRAITQVLTTLSTPGPANAANIYQRLVAQKIISLPFPNQTIAATDLAQFGIAIRHEGPRLPGAVLFKSAADFSSSYTQQASLGIDHRLSANAALSANYMFVRGAKIARARDENLLPAPVDPELGARVWSEPFFKDPDIYQDNVYESSGNSFYHGLTFEFQRRFSGRFSLDLNYTFSKAIDEVVDFNSDFQPSDQLNLRAERALSSFDQRHKFVGFASVVGPLKLHWSPVVRANSGRPFNLLTGFDLNGDRHSTTDRPVSAGRNTGRGPSFWAMDLRVSRAVDIGEKATAEVMIEGFNVLNRLNYRSVNNTVGNITAPFNLRGRSDRGPSEPLGFTAAFEARRMQLGLRVRF